MHDEHDAVGAVAVVADVGAGDDVVVVAVGDVGSRGAVGGEADGEEDKELVERHRPGRSRTG